MTEYRQPYNYEPGVLGAALFVMGSAFIGIVLFILGSIFSLIMKLFRRHNV